MTDKTTSRANWMVMLPVAAGAVAYLVFVFLPGRQLAADLQSQLRARTEYLAQAGAVSVALTAAEQELQTARRYTDQRRAMAPSTSRVSELFAKIHQIEQDAGVHVVRFDPQPIEYRKSISEIPISVGCTGNFSQVYSLIHGLESLSADIWVKRLQLEKMPAPGEDIQCWIDLVIFADNHDNSDYANKSQ